MSDPDPEGEGGGEGDEEEELLEKEKDAENPPENEEEGGFEGATRETDGAVPQSLKNCQVLIKNCSVVGENALVDMSGTGDHSRVEKDDTESQTTAEHCGDEKFAEDDLRSKELNNPKSCEDLCRHTVSPHDTEAQRTNSPQENKNSKEHFEDREGFDQNGKHEDDPPYENIGYPVESQVLNTSGQEENGDPPNFAVNSNLDEQKAEDTDPQNPDLGESASLETGPKSPEEDTSLKRVPHNSDLHEERLEDNKVCNTSLEDEERSQKGHNDDEQQSRANQDPYASKEQQHQNDNYEREHSRYEEGGSNGLRLGYASESYDQGTKYEQELHHGQRSGYVANMENGSERAKYEEAEQVRYHDRPHELEQMQKVRYTQELPQHHQDGRYDHGHRDDSRHYASSLRSEHKEDSRYGTPMKTEPIYDQQDHRSCYEPRYDNDHKPVGLNPSLGFKQESGPIPRVKQELGNAHEVQVKQEPLQPPAPPVKRGPGRPRNGSRPEGYVPPIKVKVEPKETVFEIMNNLEQIFKGAFLQDSEEEDAVEDENFITVQVVITSNKFYLISSIFLILFVSR